VLQSRDLTDRAQCRAAELKDAFGKGVGHRKDLIDLLVQKQMVITKVRTRHVLVEVLGFDVERKGGHQQEI
jgi:hypothetical protein